MRFPRFTGTMRHSDFLPPVARHFVAFVRRYHPTAETIGSPRFLGNPCTHALLVRPRRSLLRQTFGRAVLLLGASMLSSV